MTDREKLIEILNEASETLLETVGSFNDNHGNGMRADYLIANGVTVQQHGQWKNGDPYCPICGKDKFRGLDADIWADWQPAYCPNCGAKMDLED